MNIFFLSNNAIEAAEMQCDQHVCKMVLETAQMLCTAHRILDGDENVPSNFYRKTHINHPMARWTRETSANYMWAYEHFIALGDEFEKRYDKKHLSIKKFEESLAALPKNIERDCFTDPPLCMPDSCKCDDIVESYRTYYIQEKSSFAQWNKSQAAPNWWPRK